MSEEMRRCGQLFRKKREEMHLSLKEVENATSIRVNSLQAIEEGKIREYLSGIYALGFLKQYAIFLGFDIGKIMLEFPSAFKMPTEKHEFSFGIGTLEMRGSVGGGVKWLPNLLWGLVGCAILFMIFIIIKAIGIL